MITSSEHVLLGRNAERTPYRNRLPAIPCPAILSGMASLVYLTNRAPAKVVEELLMAGHRAWECLTVSEALYLCEHERIDAIVIDSDVEDPDVIEAQMRHITLRRKANATAQDLIWELSNLFPQTSTRVQ